MPPLEPGTFTALTRILRDQHPAKPLDEIARMAEQIVEEIKAGNVRFDPKTKLIAHRGQKLTTDEQVALKAAYNRRRNAVLRETTRVNKALRSGVNPYPE